MALGYKGEMIKRYFVDYVTLSGDLTVCLGDGSVDRHAGEREDWNVHLIDTGRDSQTGGRIGRLRPWLGGETFMLTYGDGVANLDLQDLVRFHRSHGKAATISAVRPPSRFGGLDFEPGRPVRFTEKPQMGEGWINGGFMALRREVLDYIADDDASFERDVLEPLAVDHQLMAYRHEGIWDEGKAPWVTWS